MARRHGAGPLTAEICRLEAIQAAACSPFERLPVTAGAVSVFKDVLPANLSSGALRTLYYRIRVVNAQGKGAAWTQTVTAAGATPDALRGLQAYPVASGILLRWQPGEDGVMFRVSRGADEAKSSLLSASGSQSQGGTLDTGGHAGQEQRYLGFRRRTVQIAGESLVVESEPVTVTVMANAKIPLPMSPTALEAVANTLGAPEVDLVWQPPDDVSVTGYRVYRQDGAAQPLLLTPEPLNGFTFADKTAKSGHGYTYRVSAVNSSGESAAVTAAAVLP